MNRILLVLCIAFCLGGCTPATGPDNELITACRELRSIEDLLNVNAALLDNSKYRARYLYAQGRCEIHSQKVDSGTSKLVAASLLGEVDESMLEIAEHYLIVNGDLSFIPVLEYLSRSEKNSVSTRASLSLGLFILIDSRFSDVKNYFGGADFDLGIELLNRVMAEPYGFYLYYFFSIFNGPEDLSVSERLDLIEKGNFVQEKALGSIQVTCDSIYKQLERFQVNNAVILDRCLSSE